MKNISWPSTFQLIMMLMRLISSPILKRWVLRTLLITKLCLVNIIKIASDNLFANFFLPGNLVSIGPGVFSSNLTLDGPVRAIYVLKNCEFMYDGRLQSIHAYVVNPGWISIQIWRPANIPQNKRNLTLLHQRTIEILESFQTIHVSMDYVHISVLCHSNGCQFKILHFVLCSVIP